MTTYRVGTHHGVIERPAVYDGDQLVAVVVNGDQALAERICALLNADDRCWHGEHCDGSGPECERDAPLKGGHRDCAAAWHANHGCTTEPYDLDAPSRPLGSPESVQNGPVVPASTTDAHNGPGGRTRPVIDMTETALRVAARTVTAIRPGIETHTARAAIQALLTMGWRPPETRGCICNDPPPTVDKPKNGTASRPDGWACPRHGTVI